MKTKSMDMTKGPLLKKILLYTLPIMLTGILQLLFNAADLVIVGRYCGSVSVGAVGATTSLINLIVNFFIGLSTGTGVAVAHGLGAKNDQEVENTVHTAIPLAVMGGGVLTAVGVLASRPMLEWMGTPAANAWVKTVANATPATFIRKKRTKIMFSTTFSAPAMVK